MPVHGLQISFMRGQLVVDDHFTASGLIQYGNFCTLSERCLAFCGDDSGVHEDTVIFYVVIGNISSVIVNERIATYMGLV